MFFNKSTEKVEQVAFPMPFSKKYLFDRQYKADIRNTLVGIIRKYSTVQGNGAILDPVDIFLDENRYQASGSLKGLLGKVNKSKLQVREKAVFWSTWNYLEEHKTEQVIKTVESKIGVFSRIKHILKN